MGTFARVIPRTTVSVVAPLMSINLSLQGTVELATRVGSAKLADEAQ